MCPRSGFNFASNKKRIFCLFPQRALDLQYHPQGHPDRRGGALRNRNPPKKPRRSPRASGAENANDGKAPARHQDGTNQHPRCTSHVRNPPETSQDERGTSSSVKALINVVADIPTSLRCIVGDQHNTTGTTRKLSFGARRHGAPTGLAQRAPPPPGGSVISNRGAGTTSSIAVVRQTTVD